MNKRASILSLLLLDDSKYISTRQFAYDHSLPSAALSLGTVLKQLTEAKYLTSKLVDQAHCYKITAKGKKYLKEQHPHNIVSAEVLATAGKKPYKSRKIPLEATPVPTNLSEATNSAIDGITNLIEENQKLNNLLRSFYMQLKDVYQPDKAENDGETDEPD